MTNNHTMYQLRNLKKELPNWLTSTGEHHSYKPRWTKHSYLVLGFTQINNYELNYFSVADTVLKTWKHRNKQDTLLFLGGRQIRKYFYIYGYSNLSLNYINSWDLTISQNSWHISEKDNMELFE